MRGKFHWFRYFSSQHIWRLRIFFEVTMIFLLKIEFLPRKTLNLIENGLLLSVRLYFLLFADYFSRNLKSNLSVKACFSGTLCWTYRNINISHPRSNILLYSKFIITENKFIYETQICFLTIFYVFRHQHFLATYWYRISEFVANPTF